MKSLKARVQYPDELQLVLRNVSALVSYRLGLKFRYLFGFFERRYKLQLSNIVDRIARVDQ